MSTFSKLFNYAKEKRVFMVMALVFSAISTIFSFIPYYYFLQILREISGNADFYIIRQIAFNIFLTTVLYAATYMLSLGFSHIFAFRLETNMKKRGINHLLSASFSFFDINPSGRTRKIIDDNTANTHTIVAHILPDFVNAVLFPLGVIVLSFTASWQVGILVLGATGFAVICFAKMGVGKEMMMEYMGALEDINSETVEYIRGIQVIKIFGLKIESFKKLYKSILYYSKVVNKQCQMCRTPYILYQTFMMSFGALIILIAYPMINANATMSQIISMVVFFMTFVGLLNTAFIKIMFFTKNHTFAKDAVDKLENLFEKMEDNKLTGGYVSEMEAYDIEFDGVSFEYDEGVKVLENLNLKLEEGKRYALVGASGGGKSTLAKLISGFYPIKSGSLMIGGIDIREYKNEVLEKNIAFVFQNAKLFNKSIYENVKIGRPDATYEEIMDALRYAMCDTILDKFESRENTIIGAKGVHLSGGEIQRIALARAILKDAPIIILDEASAASDPENEYEMQRAISSLMKGKTVIMIAHRLTSIREVDEILLVENGKIAERGSHEALMAANGKYKHSQELFRQANEWRLEK